MPILDDPLIVPGYVEVNDGSLPWRDDDAHPPRRVSVPAALLDKFMSLRGQSNERIASFAAKYGILGICSHQLPRTHRLLQIADRGDIGCEPVGMELGEEGYHGHEPVAAWRMWANHARDVVTLGAAAQHALNPDVTTWRRLFNERSLPQGKTLRGDVAKLVQYWLTLGGVRPQFSWDTEGRPRITFSTRDTWDPMPVRVLRLHGYKHGTTLFGALAVQLMLRVADRDMAVCSACGMDYMPSRRPAAGRRTYCADCRANGAPERDALREHRRRHPRGRGLIMQRRPPRVRAR
jgi:hypothetical protein